MHKYRGVVGLCTGHPNPLQYPFTTSSPILSAKHDRVYGFIWLFLRLSFTLAECQSLCGIVPQSGIVIRCSRCIADIVNPGSSLTSPPQVGPPWTGVSQTPSGISVPSLPEPPDCLFPFWNKQRRAFTSEVEERPSQVKESDAYFALA